MALVTKKSLQISDLTDDKLSQSGGQYTVAVLTRDIAIPDMDVVPAGTRGIVEFASPPGATETSTPYRKKANDNYSSRYVLFMFPRQVTGEIIATRYFASRIVPSTAIDIVGYVNLTEM